VRPVTSVTVTAAGLLLRIRPHQRAETGTTTAERTFARARFALSAWGTICTSGSRETKSQWRSPSACPARIPVSAQQRQQDAVPQVLTRRRVRAHQLLEAVFRPRPRAAGTLGSDPSERRLACPLSCPALKDPPFLFGLRRVATVRSLHVIARQPAAGGCQLAA
jgi:hypothetical protein